MKKANIVCFNHMDEIWRRCFRDHFYYEGLVIRPYTDIEEALFNQWIGFLEKSNCKYSIEQSLTVKEYLERNPDKLGQFKQLVQDSRIELLGGGETIIDYNLVHGESIVRSHLYSILWYKENIGAVPGIGIATDTFGLSAQLPQIFRKLGYDALILHCRVFDHPKAFWKGLNGELIYFKQEFGDLGLTKFEESDYKKYVVCSACKGEGCKNCGYTGIDYSYRRYSLKDTLESVFKKMQQSSRDEFLLTFGSEEVLESDSFTDNIEEYGSAYEIDIKFTTFADIVAKWAKQYIEQLKNNRWDEKDIDGRVEGNPIGTGCYVSRIELKKINRSMEELLLSGEKFAAIASQHGMPYPGEKIRRLWSMMSLFQFHDAITASHADAAYEELRKIARDVKLGAVQIYNDAMKKIEKKADIPYKEGYESFLLFNPLNWEVHDLILEAVIRLTKDRPVPGLKVEDTEGNEYEVIDFNSVDTIVGKTLNFRFKGVRIPSLGYKAFYYKIAKSTDSIITLPESHIENEYYIIRTNSVGIAEIYDKELKCPILKEGTGDIMVEEDYGSPWETLNTPYFCESTAAPFGEIDITQRKPNIQIKIEESGSRRSIIIKGAYSYPERKINKLDWKQEVTLYRGIKKIFFKTEVDWDAYSHRIMVRFPLSFRTPEDEAYYEIPYGTLKRQAYQGQYGTHMNPNGDWPALNFVSCYNNEENYTVSVFNKGLPGWKVKEGTLYSSVLRSPESPVYIFDNKGVKDEGLHIFEYMITSNTGGLKEGTVVQKGIEFNTEFMTCPGTYQHGCLGTEHSFMSNESPNVIISTIKKAEYSDNLVVRAYEAYGDAVIDSFRGTDNRKIIETDLLEGNCNEVDTIALGGFEIKTFKL